MDNTQDPHNAMTSPLLNLPGELLNHVISNFHGYHDRPSLWGLCLTSKELQRIVQPLMYRKLTIFNPRRPTLFKNEVGVDFPVRSGNAHAGEVDTEEVNAEEFHAEEEYEPNGRPIYTMDLIPFAMLIRTLSKRPDLARAAVVYRCRIPDNIRSTVKGGALLSRSFREVSGHSVSAEDVQLFYDLKPSWVRDDTQWREDVVNIRVAAFNILLLERMPNLKYLYLRAGPGLIRDYPPNGLTFNNLEILELGAEFEDAMFNLGGYVGLLKSPSLRWFSAIFCYANHDTTPLVLQRSSLLLNTIQLCDCSFDKHSLGALLGSATNLAAFVYSGVFNEDFATNHFLPADIHEPLERHAKTLISLFLQFDMAWINRFGDENDENGRVRKLPDLKGLHNLQFIALEHGRLEHISMLPPSLTQLGIIDMAQCDLSGAQQILTANYYDLPLLRRIGIERDAPSEDNDRIYDTLCQTAKQMGAEFPHCFSGVKIKLPNLTVELDRKSSLRLVEEISEDEPETQPRDEADADRMEVDLDGEET
ncbi:hypothetical protein CC80DRAFT_503629 [Byssothecium circinans]|uniref:F-box domain-containing protein n=1 Tax=Byssothecium circinans TaxID=147558 RepID=A0A6A5U7Z4_9PLEO|nr:hypothetical protein CC80DRAFT_503629 [Byssothecium circinans]